MRWSAWLPGLPQISQRPLARALASVLSHFHIGPVYGWASQGSASATAWARAPHSGTGLGGRESGSRG
jgi:hypothetical protein